MGHVPTPTVLLSTVKTWASFIAFLFRGNSVCSVSSRKWFTPGANKNKMMPAKIMTKVKNTQSMKYDEFIAHIPETKNIGSGWKWNTGRWKTIFGNKAGLLSG